MASMASSVQRDNCAICLELLNPEEASANANNVTDTTPVRPANCTHIFHRNCIGPWMVQNANAPLGVPCPLCKRRFVQLMTAYTQIPRPIAAVNSTALQIMPASRGQAFELESLRPMNIRRGNEYHYGVGTAGNSADIFRILHEQTIGIRINPMLLRRAINVLHRNSRGYTMTRTIQSQVRAQSITMPSSRTNLSPIGHATHISSARYSRNQDDEDYWFNIIDVESLSRNRRSYLILDGDDEHQSYQQSIARIKIAASLILAALAMGFMVAIDGGAIYRAIELSTRVADRQLEFGIITNRDLPGTERRLAIPNLSLAERRLALENMQRRLLAQMIVFTVMQSYRIE